MTENEKNKILIVDDDEGIRISLAAFLSRAGFGISIASDGEEALTTVESDPPDLILLDVLMPRLDGREVLRKLRRSKNWTPVILLTQVGEAVERAMALEEGADDYINKPFDPHELVARIRAVLRRMQPATPPLSAVPALICGELRMDRVAHKVSLGGEKLILTPKAMILLEYLMSHPDELIQRERLLDVVWGWEVSVATRAVDARIAELRHALNDDPDNPVYIETVIGMGYRFIGPVERG